MGKNDTAPGSLLNDDPLMSSLEMLRGNSTFTPAPSQPLFSQKMALAPHLYTLALSFNCQTDSGGAEEQEGVGEQSDGETDTWNTPSKGLRGEE